MRWRRRRERVVGRLELGGVASLAGALLSAFVPWEALALLATVMVSVLEFSALVWRRV